MTDYKITLSDIAQAYKDYADCGATAIKLTYKEGELTVHILCTDDCEPYWNYAFKEECTFENWTLLLYYIANKRFINYHGEEYPVKCVWLRGDD